MGYQGLFDAVYARLEELGATGTAIGDDPATDEALAATETEMGVHLPEELREFYRTVGDGHSFFWESDPDDHSKPWGSLKVPSLAGLAEMYRGWRGLALYTPDRAEAYGFTGTKDPDLAKRTAARMWHWLPVVGEPSGDAICIDLGAPGYPVVLDEHDWMDGGTGDNGHVLAGSWREFLVSWGRVCFRDPIHWTRCLRSGGGVDWGAEPFRGPFRLTGPGEPGEVT